jgi:hypothetical protein
MPRRLIDQTAARLPPVHAKAMPSAREGQAVRPEDVESWLADLGLVPLQRADREVVTAWDVDLDGRRRFDLRTTLILDPPLGLICWAHLAPPIGDGLRKAYRLLLGWNDDFPFAKFSIAADGRPILAVELPSRYVDRDELGLALCRIVGIADRLLEQTAAWLWIGGRLPAGYSDRTSRNPELLARYAAQLPELFDPEPSKS